MFLYKYASSSSEIYMDLKKESSSLMLPLQISNKDLIELLPYGL